MMVVLYFLQRFTSRSAFFLKAIDLIVGKDGHASLNTLRPPAGSLSTVRAAIIAAAPRRFRLGRAAGSKHKITQQAITGGRRCPR
jgi:hypothetical protein